MIIAPELKHHAPAHMIDFYKKSFRNVHAVHCLNCKNTVAIELSDPITNDLLGLKPNQIGVIVLPVDEKLLSHRIRFDGMVGYQCSCGNDTRSCDIEEKHSPTGEFHPHEVAAILQDIADSGWEAPVKIKNGIEHRDNFAVERVN